ncbi:MAG: glutamate synthase-related protein [Candidatus Bipolaricaulota bacterium]|nr:glutamate synthase-related protein [Candidatus Bipolaricaulota bacterium]
MVIATRSESRYSIHTQRAPSRATHLVRPMIVRSDACINCGICIDACIYGVHYRSENLRMIIGEQPQDQSLCRSCLRCVRECPQNALSAPIQPEWLHTGDDYWTPEIIQSLLQQAETGKVPVSGQGYRGPFAGRDFDSMWTDMSEIVRPTRDGIHGREYISTAIFLGRKPFALTSPPLQTRADPILEIPIPMLFDAIPEYFNTPSVCEALLLAAQTLGTFCICKIAECPTPLPTALAPLIRPDEIARYSEIIRQALLVELEYDGQRRSLENALAQIRQLNPNVVIAARLEFDDALAEELARAGVGVLHLVADSHGRTNKLGHIKDALRAVHLRLLEARLRDQVTIMVSGGIAAAEHVPKAIICGADGVALDWALLVALERWRGTPAGRDGGLDPHWGAQRIVNLIGAWRDQLLEVLGAMGMREVRRLRGEVGRAIFHEDLEREFKEYLRSDPIGLARPEEIQYALENPHGLIPPLTGEIRPLPPNFHHELSKFKITISDACINCGLCVELCPFGVYARPEGLNKLLPPQSANCIGPVCKDSYPDNYCVDKCPTNAITIEREPTYELLGDPRWTADLLLATYKMAETGRVPEHVEHRIGASGGGFDRLRFTFEGSRVRKFAGSRTREPSTAIPLNRRSWGPKLWIPVPWYGGGMSYGSISLQTMLSRARAAKAFGTFVSTGEGGYPEALFPYDDYIITQIATGLFGVREETIQRVRIVEFKYAQGAKPGLGGHLLADKVTADVAKMRGSVQFSSLFSPFPFHSVYSVEDHKKHVDWVRATNPNALVAVKVSTPNDVDMVAVGSYYAGAHIIHLDGGYGGTGAAPDIAKKNIAMPIEYAIPKVHKFLVQEGIRDELVLMASGGIRTAYDIAKAIALGADGCIIGTAELVAIECNRCGNCERGRGCPFGIATTDPELSQLIAPDWGAQRIINLFHAWRAQLIEILQELGMKSILELRGRVDLLEYIDEILEGSEPCRAS